VCQALEHNLTIVTVDGTFRAYPAPILGRSWRTVKQPWSPNRHLDFRLDFIICFRSSYRIGLQPAMSSSFANIQIQYFLF
jgi:hypothetical protein